MRAIIQRVSKAGVVVNGGEPRTIGRGMVVLLGVGEDDTRAEAEKLWAKIHKLRIFSDEADKTNLALPDVDGELLIVSQFTLFADCRKGNRPSFIHAGAPEMAIPLYEYFIELARAQVPHVQTGEFGADMQVDLVNDGPFTIWLDTDEL